MKKPKLTLWKEFKAFINRGSVLDLAVGMIIGSAFTAIVSSLVNGILKPLINLIPLSKDGTGLQTVLREAVVGADGAVVTEALILDWGAVISAVITFLLTALVLFAIIKVINNAKNFNAKEKARIEKQLKKGKISADEAEAQKTAVEEVAAPAEPVETTDDILKDIRTLLIAQQKPVDEKNDEE